ncbi:hypothetical protein YC2023_120982 [Brassica napus]
MKKKIKPKNRCQTKGFWNHYTPHTCSVLIGRLSFFFDGKKENLSEMEQQLKKTEAAQRRKVQIEKAARESELMTGMVLVLFLQAEAIRKILGQDSSRKKREDKIKKRLDELAQERASTSYIRTIMGPNGTTV